MKSREQLREPLDPIRSRIAGMVRRMVVSATTKAIWTLTGFRLPNGAAEETEKPKAEIFGGIGLHARPPANGKPEAIVVNVGADPDHPVIVALRDEATRAAVAKALKVNETMLFNSLAFVHIKDDGTVEVRTLAGAAVSLALKSDVQECVNKFNGHLHLAPSGGGTTGGPLGPGPPPGAVAMANPTGTTVLKGH